MISVDLHDANENDPVEGKMKSPTHAASSFVDYEYQAEQRVIDTETEYPHIVRIVFDDGRREFRRDAAGRFVEERKVRHMITFDGTMCRVPIGERFYATAKISEVTCKTCLVALRLEREAPRR